MNMLIPQIVTLIIAAVFGGGLLLEHMVFTTTKTSLPLRLLHGSITCVLGAGSVINFLFAKSSYFTPVPCLVPSSTRAGWRYCDECVKPKAADANHCSTCQTCVYRLDHHCVFLGRCVGHHNHRQFLCFLLYLEVAVLYVLAMFFWFRNSVASEDFRYFWIVYSESAVLLGFANKKYQFWYCYTLLSHVVGDFPGGITIIALYAEALVALATSLFVGILGFQSLLHALQGTRALKSNACSWFSKSNGKTKVTPLAWTNLRIIFEGPVYTWLLPTWKPPKMKKA